MDEKQILRSSMKEKLNEIDDNTYEKYSNLIKNRLIEHPYWKRAKTIGITISRGKEVDTSPIIKAAWQEGKCVSVPKCLPKERAMDFRLITNFDQLEDSYFGLKEPIISITKPVRPNEIDLLIVPGLIYDKSGYRIGFGGGYYDRYLTTYTGLTLSLAFQLQVVESVPTESFDQPVAVIITNEQTYQHKR